MKNIADEILGEEAARNTAMDIDNVMGKIGRFLENAPAEVEGIVVFACCDGQTGTFAMGAVDPLIIVKSACSLAQNMVEDEDASEQSVDEEELDFARLLLNNPQGGGSNATH